MKCIKMSIPFERMCRACMMTEAAAALMPIWPSPNDANDIITSNETVSSVATMFTSFTVFGATAGDGLPENICLMCISEMNQAYSFKQKCERSELALRAFHRRMQRTETEAPTTSRPVMNVVSIESTAHIKLKPAKQLSYLIQDQITDGSSKPNYQCMNCWMTFDTSAEIETHLLEDICAIECPEKSPIDDIDADYDIDDSGDVHDSPVAIEENISQLKSDVDEETNKPAWPPRYICENCKKSFLSQHALNTHTDSKKCYEQTFECDICKHTYATKRNIRRHIHRQHRVEKIRKNAKGTANQDKKYKCAQCPKAFIMKSALRDHLRTHSGERPFLCSMCGKGFGQSANLRQHMMRHSQMKPYQCGKCPKTFVSKGELNSHQRAHDGAHPFVCDICGSGFTTSSSMTKHRRIHTGERRYACEYCPLRFTALSTMKNHRRIHTGERPYQCQHCSRSFSQRSDCVSHTRIHTGERPYKCEMCDGQFYKSCSLRTHMKKEHDMTLESTVKRYPKETDNSSV